MNANTTTQEHEKRFYCYWGAGYKEKAPETNDIYFFSEENGYWQADIEAIHALKVGEKLDLTEMGAEHHVIRAK